MFKLGNGYWLKIPKGRELSLLGITADRVADAVRGKDVDILSTINTMGNQVAPANPLTSNIFPRSSTPSSSTRTVQGGRGTAETLRASACRTTHRASATTAVRTCSPRPWARRWASRRKS